MSNELAIKTVAAHLAKAGRYWAYDPDSPSRLVECVESEENSEWLRVDSERVVEFGPGRVREALEDVGMFDPDDHSAADAALTAELEDVLSWVIR